jgi:hypothetical protein
LFLPENPDEQRDDDDAYRVQREFHDTLKELGLSEQQLRTFFEHQECMILRD